MNSDYIQSITRNTAQVVLGYFVAKGFVDKDNAELLVAAVASAAVMAWGVWHQWKHKKTERDLSNQDTTTT